MKLFLMIKLENLDLAVFLRRICSLQSTKALKTVLEAVSPIIVVNNANVTKSSKSLILLDALTK